MVPFDYICQALRRDLTREGLFDENEINGLSMSAVSNCPVRTLDFITHLTQSNKDTSFIVVTLITEP